MKLYNLCCNSLLTDLSALVLIHPPLYGQSKKKRQIPVVITHNESLWMTLTFLMAKSKILNSLPCPWDFTFLSLWPHFMSYFLLAFSALICLDSLYQSFLNT